MIKKSRKQQETDVADVIDNLIETEFIPTCNEELDEETLKLLDEYDMESTMNSVETQTEMGQLMVGENQSFSAVFTPSGSSSVSTMAYDGNMLRVTFRTNPKNEYSYTASEAVLEQIREEVDATLIDGEGSVGKLMNSLLNNRSIQLI